MAVVVPVDEDGLVTGHDAWLIDYVPVLSRAATFTYNGNGTIATMTSGGKTYTYTWNTDGTLATESDGTNTRTFTYTNGNVTSVA